MGKITKNMNTWPDTFTKAGISRKAVLRGEGFSMGM